MVMMLSMTKITIKELVSAADMLSMYPLLQQRYPTMERVEFVTLLEEMRSNGYKAIAAENEQNELVGVSGFWINCQFYNKRTLRIDNFIIDAEHQNQGIGRAMLAWMEDFARGADCQSVILDSYVTNETAHRFYFREGFAIKCLHFSKKI